MDEPLLSLSQLSALKDLVEGDRAKLSDALLYIHELCVEKESNDEDDDSIYWGALASVLKIASDKAIF